MYDHVIEYQCKICGHRWTWSYLFVVRCRVCKTYHSFDQAAVNPHELPSIAAPDDEHPISQPSIAAPDDEHPVSQPSSLSDPACGRLVLERNGGYSRSVWRLGGDEDGLPSVG